ncbi:MAG: hypothetical protein QG671_2535 [Actinomycetota bacterium]|nr:hypothetical protein [Actinomycetota bacterium]
MIAKVFAPIFLAGAAAAAVALAPVASATNEAQCSDSGLSSVCTKNGHAKIVATPGTTAGGAGYWPFGSGPTPPVLAMD